MDSYHIYLAVSQIPLRETRGVASITAIDPDIPRAAREEGSQGAEMYRDDIFVKKFHVISYHTESIGIVSCHPISINLSMRLPNGGPAESAVAPELLRTVKGQPNVDPSANRASSDGPRPSQAV